MTDLELTKLCAEVVGLEVGAGAGNGKHGTGRMCYADQAYILYDPLHDDAQAMALVKKFKLDIEWVGTDTDLWNVEYAYSDESLNRAICKCIADQQSR